MASFICWRCNRTEDSPNPPPGFCKVMVHVVREIGDGRPGASYGPPNRFHLCDDCIKEVTLSVNIGE